MSKRAYDILLIVLIVVTVIVAFLFAQALFEYFANRGGSETQPTVTDPWQRIQAEGKIVVGTSADYPPFATYNDAYQLDGFDIALMREIAQTWGVQVEFTDMAFDGLNGAIQLGQIDAAIGAISKTPTREQVVDFGDASTNNQKTLDAYMKQFTVGQRTLLDVLDARNELFQSSGLLVTAKVNEVIAQERLLALAGTLNQSLVDLGV